MKLPFLHLVWMSMLLCGVAGGQAATHTVKPGDNLSKIARSHGCTVEALAKANGINLSAIIQAGQQLKLPPKTGAAPSGGNHVIQQGDTFSSISRKYDIPVKALLAANPGLDPRALKPGQKILLPGQSDPAVSEKTSSPSHGSGDPPESAQPTLSEPGVGADIAGISGKHADGPVDSVKTQPAEEKIRTIVVDAEITFGAFAAKYGSDIERLNELNGLDLAGATVLAKGSELYVPLQTQDEP